MEEPIQANFAGRDVSRRTVLRALTGLGAALLLPMVPDGVQAAPGSVRALPEGARAPRIPVDAGCALLVIDVQNCFVTGGTLAIKNGEAVVPVINRLGGVFDTVIATQDWHTPDHVSFASAHPGRQPYELIDLAYGPQMLWPDHCVQGTDDAKLYKDLDLSRAQLILRKGYHRDVDSYSAFAEADHKTATGLGGYLRQRGVHSVFLTGLATDYCVASTAIDACEAGFTAYVIEDACRGVDLRGSLAAAWQHMAARGVHRIQSADILT